MSKKIGSWMAAVALAAAIATPARTQQPKKEQAPKPYPGQAAEYLLELNAIGSKLVTMAEDWPEDKYDFKPNPAQRTFAEQLLHAAGTNYVFIAAAKGEKPNYDDENPMKDKPKTKAAVVAYVKKAFADAAAVIKEQGDAGLAGVVKFPYGNRMDSRSFLWLDDIEHAGEHYGQLVVYYRVNNQVPPESRPRK